MHDERAMRSELERLLLGNQSRDSVLFGANINQEKGYVVFGNHMHYGWVCRAAGPTQLIFGKEFTWFEHEVDGHTWRLGLTQNRVTFYEQNRDTYTWVTPDGEPYQPGAVIVGGILS